MISTIGNTYLVTLLFIHVTGIGGEGDVENSKSFFASVA